MTGGPRVLIVASGKGGVGKSTIAVNLAVAAGIAGRSVVVFDADVHGHSVAQLMGVGAVTAKPARDLSGKVELPVAHGVRVMSPALFLGNSAGGEEVVSWRGPLIHRFLASALGSVDLGRDDILIVDTPPGTGDVLMSMAQLLPHSDVLLVEGTGTLDVSISGRGAILARRLGQRIVATVSIDTVGSSSAPPLRGGDEDPPRTRVPYSSRAREASDAGVPLIVFEPLDAASEGLREFALSLFDPSTPCGSPT